MPRKTAPGLYGRRQRRAASMRPRPDAAENLRAQARRFVISLGFNEAAARCRGKRWRTRARGRWSSRFNEAAARCRGKHVAVSAPRVSDRPLQ